MDQSIELNIGSDPVRFTPEGMVFIRDAIKALSCSQDEESDAVWEKIKNDYPGILIHCSEYITEEGAYAPTINIEGLDEIFRLLPDYIEC